MLRLDRNSTHLQQQTVSRNVSQPQAYVLHFICTIELIYDVRLSCSKCDIILVHVRGKCEYSCSLCE